MNSEFAQRTKRFALRILNVANALPKTPAGKALANQIARSGTSVAANHRSAIRGRSRADFIAKLQIALEEADETLFWLELIEESGALPPEKLEGLHAEANEITAILAASVKTAKSRPARK